MGLLVALALGPTSAAACTGISLVTTEGAHVQARTIEWGDFDLNSRLIVSPRGTTFTSRLPMEKTGRTWTSRLGFVGISVSEDRFIGEGMNEAGLNAGLFYFSGYGSLAPYDPRNTARNVADMDLVRWMLSQFASVDEVKKALPAISVAPIFIDADGTPSPTAHWRVTDRKGGNIVIEIINRGEVRIYDNKVGVLTNSPDFPWMLTNLNTYIQIAPGTVPPRREGGVELRSFGVGTASLGLPGDISPPSRFVRASFYRNTAPPLKSEREAVEQAFHILANFTIPIGVEFGAGERERMPDLPSATQWTAVSDLSGGSFYYRTMRDSTIKRVDLNRIDFGSGSERAVAIDDGGFTSVEVRP